MRTFYLCLTLLIGALSVGCGKTPSVDVNIPTDNMSFVIDETTICTIRVPTSEQLLYSDHATYYESSAGTKIMSTNIQSHATEKKSAEYNNVWCSKSGCSVDVGTGSLVVKCSEDLLPYYMAYLGTATSTDTKSVYPERLERNIYDKNHIDRSDNMELTSNGNYMPVDSIKSISGRYTSDLISDGENWCKSWVQDGLVSDIQQAGMTYMKLTGPISACSTSKDLVCFINDNALFVAKAIHYNTWVVYYSSHNFDDYLWTAVDRVHAEEGAS